MEGLQIPSGSENQEILRLIFTVSKTRGALQLYAKQMHVFLQFIAQTLASTYLLVNHK